MGPLTPKNQKWCSRGLRLLHPGLRQDSPLAFLWVQVRPSNLDAEGSSALWNYLWGSHGHGLKSLCDFNYQNILIIQLSKINLSTILNGLQSQFSVNNNIKDHWFYPQLDRPSVSIPCTKVHGIPMVYMSIFTIARQTPRSESEFVLLRGPYGCFSNRRVLLGHKYT